MGQQRESTMEGFAHRTQGSIAIRAPGLTVLLSAFLVAGGCATLPGGGSPLLQEQLDAIISVPPLDQVHWGIRIVDPERGQVLYSHNGHRKFVPASNMKVLSTATALALLGPEYRYQTELWGVGPLQERGSVLQGDLVLRATGDPTLSERFYPSAEAPLDSLAEAVWTSGIRAVTGSLIVDASGWDSVTVPGNWVVSDLPARYAATGGAFSIADGELTVEVTAGAVAGAPSSVRWWPGTGEDFFSAAFVTTQPDSTARAWRADYLPESRRLRVEGRISPGAVDTIRVSQRDPAGVASAALLRALERKGIEVRGGVRVTWDAGVPLGPGGCVTGYGRSDPPAQGRSLPECPGSVRLANLRSPPMAEIVKAILEPSQNWMTEQLVRTLGAERGRKGSWSEGFRVQRDFLVHEVGVDSLDIAFEDGSGLSAYNLVTPRALVQILDHMRDSPNAGIYRNAMASPGETESTLSTRLAGLEDRVFAKTGTITHVNSLSGYVFTDSGRELIFSILTNGAGLPSQMMRNAIDRLLLVVARH